MVESEARTVARGLRWSEIKIRFEIKIRNSFEIRNSIRNKDSK